MTAQPMLESLEIVLAAVRAELLALEQSVRVGTITIHVGCGDYQIEVNSRVEKIPRARKPQTPQRRTWE